MSIVKPKNFSYIKGPKGDKGDRGEPGSGVVGATGRITYNSATKTIGFNETGLATQSYVNTSINNLINGAPLVLDTLNELAAAIDNNPTFVTDITANINGKLSLSGGTLTGTLVLNADPVNNLEAATKQYVDNVMSSIVTSYNDLTDKPTKLSDFINDLNLDGGEIIFDGENLGFSNGGVGGGSTFNGGNVNGSTRFVSGVTFTSTTSFGDISLVTIDGGNPGDVLSTDGAGTLSWVPQTGGSGSGSGGASTSLNNLTSTAINVSLVPDSNVTLSLIHI
jgi:hypothetical protein